MKRNHMRRHQLKWHFFTQLTDFSSNSKQVQVCSLNERGSALLTVILVVAFLTILATTLLYVSGMNFIIKQADYQNKKNFYTGETALEEIKAHLMGEIVSNAGRQAYNEVCKTYVVAGGADARQVRYNQYFVEAMKNELNAALGSGTWQDYLSSKYSDSSHAKLVMKSPTVARDGLGALVDEKTSGGTLVIDETNGVLTIRGLELTYINDNKLATVISTDLEIHAPEVSWDATESKKDLSGTTVEEAIVKDKVSVAKCVCYTNWVKE